MGRYYSLDLRQRVASFVEAGHSRRAAARQFGVSDSCAIKLAKRLARFGTPAPARQGRPPGSGRLLPYEAFLVQVVEAEPAVTMPELAARRLAEHGVVAASAVLSRLICRLGFTYKKIPDGCRMRTRRHSLRRPRLEKSASAAHAPRAAQAGVLR